MEQKKSICRWLPMGEKCPLCYRNGCRGGRPIDPESMRQAIMRADKSRQAKGKVAK